MRSPSDRHQHDTSPARTEESASRVEAIPAGGAGADSGAVDVTGIDEEDRAEIPNISSQNDIPGVGTRGPDGSMETSPPDPAYPADPGEENVASAAGEEEEQDTSPGLIGRLEPGVDPEAARTSRLVGEDS